MAHARARTHALYSPLLSRGGAPNSFDAEALVPGEEEVDVEAVEVGGAGAEGAVQQEGRLPHLGNVRVLAHNVPQPSFPVRQAN